MTDAEREVMHRHVEYWKVFAEKGVAIAFGPVLDPNGPWGVAIVELENDSAAQTIADNDPVIKANIGSRTFVSPMPNIVLGKAVGG